jgi:hypothetical protein
MVNTKIKHAQRRALEAWLCDTPELAVLIDPFAQRVQRPQAPTVADTYYSGKQKQHTHKSQVTVDEMTGLFVDVSERVPGPTADITRLERLPAGVGVLGDVAYVGIAQVHPTGEAACPRRTPRGQPCPPEDLAFHTAFARRRIYVEHAIGCTLRFPALPLGSLHGGKGLFTPLPYSEW